MKPITELNHQPLQPLGLDEHGRERFKANAIVEYLLEKGPFDMNHLASLDFSIEDREQFAQLIGYSLDGFCELSYVRDETYGVARTVADNGCDEKDARIATLTVMLDKARSAIRNAATAVFRIHPDDLRA